MSSKKNKSKQKPAKQSPRDMTTEQLTKQLNADDDSREQSDSISILAEYERKASEAEQRMAERLRASEQERAEKAEKSAKPDKSEKSDEAAKQDRPAAVSPAGNDGESDVKQFVPHSASDTSAHTDAHKTGKESFTEGFNEALSENYDDLTGDEPAGNEPAEEQDAEAAERPNRFYLVFAVFVIIMSIIGIISTVNFAAGVISDIANRTDLKNELALFLYPVVCVDPPDCDSADELPSTVVIEAAIWKIILTGDNSNYDKLYNTYMYIPATDVAYSVRSIFGNSVEIRNQTVGTMDITFTYVEDMNSYLAPINPHYTAYSPRITDVSNIGELYTVTVEYLPPSALSVEGIEFENTAQKTMVYTLSRSKGSTTLHSIKNITRLDNSYGY